jgi:hypothetical protein
MTKLNNYEKKFIRNWTKKKDRGQRHYILTRGLLWGLVMAVLMPVIRALDELSGWDAATVIETYTTSEFFVRLFIFSAMGLGIHAYHWNLNTKRYHQLKNIERRSQAMANATQG